MMMRSKELAKAGVKKPVAPASLPTVQTNVPATEAVPAGEKKTIQVECLINAKVLYWTAGLATGATIGIAAFVAWKMIRDRKRK